MIFLELIIVIEIEKARHRDPIRVGKSGGRKGVGLYIDAMHCIVGYM